MPERHLTHTFLKDNLAVGVMMNLESTTETDYNGSTTTKITSSNSLIAPFLRYYVGSGDVRFFGEGFYGFGNEKVKQGTSSTSYSLSGFGLSAGPAIFIGDNASIEATLGYQSLGHSEKYNNQTIRISENNFGVKIGFKIYIK